MASTDLTLPPVFEEMRERVLRGQPLQAAEVTLLTASGDVLALGAVASASARRRWADHAWYARPLRLPLTPTCPPGCSVCHEWFGDRQTDTVEAMTAAVAASSATEVHLVATEVELSVPPGAVDATPLAYCDRLIRGLRATRPALWLQAFTPAQVDSLARSARLPVDAVMHRLQTAGLDGLLGGDEEIFTSQGRVLATSDSLSPDAERSLHEAAHRAGLVTVATLRYHPRDNPADWMERLSSLRALQHQTGGFSVFCAIPDEVATDSVLRQAPGGYEDLCVTALARLVLHNVPHIRVPWMALGLKMGPVALSFGADDLGWAPLDPHVRAFAQPASFLGLTEKALCRLAGDANFAAVAVDGAWRSLAEVVL